MPLMLGGECPLDPGIECAGRHRPALARKLSAGPEQDQCRNRLDAEAGGEGRLGFGVDFADAHSGLIAGGGGFEHWSHHAAWAAPLGPEINEQWQLGTGVAFEARRIEGERRAREERAMTAPAPGTLG